MQTREDARRGDRGRRVLGCAGLRFELGTVRFIARLDGVDALEHGDMQHRKVAIRRRSQAVGRDDWQGDAIPVGDDIGARAECDEQRRDAKQDAVHLTHVGLPLSGHGGTDGAEKSGSADPKAKRGAFLRSCRELSVSCAPRPDSR